MSTAIITADHHGYVANESMCSSRASVTTTMPNHRPQVRPLMTAPPAAMSSTPNTSHARAQIHSDPNTAPPMNQLDLKKAKIPSNAIQMPENRSMTPENSTQPLCGMAIVPAEV